MSMLENFFDIRKDSRKLFEGCLLYTSRITLVFQIFQTLRVLCFKDCNAGIDGIVNDYIASAFSMLLVLSLIHIYR